MILRTLAVVCLAWVGAQAAQIRGAAPVPVLPAMIQPLAAALSAPAPAPLSPLAQFAHQHLAELRQSDPALFERTLDLLRVYESAKNPDPKIVGFVDAVYFDGYASLEKLGIQLPEETRRHVDAMVAVLEAVTPRSSVLEPYKAPQVNRLINTFGPLLHAYAVRNDPPAPVVPPLTPNQLAARLIKDAQAWTKKWGRPFDAAIKDWLDWCRSPAAWIAAKHASGRLDPHSARNLEVVTALIEDLAQSKAAFAAELSHHSWWQNPTPNSVRTLYDAWQRLRWSAVQAALISADSKDPLVSRRGLVANLDTNTGRTPGAMAALMSPVGAMDRDVVLPLDELYSAEKK
jgi:hypothetical protein